MNEQLQQVKINADNISSVLSRKKSSLRGIKVERKRLLLKQVDDKKKKRAEKKLESKRSPFGNSLKKIKKSTSTNTLFKGLGGNLMKFVSLLLLGVALNNIDEIKEKISEAFSEFKKGFKIISSVVKTIYDGASKFISLFEGEGDKDSTIERAIDEFDESKPFLNDIESLAKELNLNVREFEKNVSDLSGKSFIESSEKSKTNVNVKEDPRVAKLQKLKTEANALLEEFNKKTFLQKTFSNPFENIKKNRKYLKLLGQIKKIENEIRVDKFLKTFDNSAINLPTNEFLKESANFSFNELNNDEVLIVNNYYKVD